MSAPRTNYAAWLAKADNDLLNIQNNLAAQIVPWDTLCFHAQQAGEKLLKAFLIHHGRTPKRTHDLVVLLGDCVQIDPSLADLAADCRTLTAHGVASRYPADLCEPQEAEAREGLEAARRLRTEIRGRLPEPAPPHGSLF